MIYFKKYHQAYEEEATLTYFGRHINFKSYYGNQHGDSLGKLKIEVALTK